MADITNSKVYLNQTNAVTVNDGAATFTIPNFIDDDEFVIVIDNQDEQAAALNILADNAIGNGKGIGDISVVAAAGTRKAIAIESYRFKTAAGKIECSITDDDGSAYSGTIADVKIVVYRRMFHEE